MSVGAGLQDRPTLAAVAIAIVSIAPMVVAGQPAAPAKKTAAAGGIPRMPDGKPDLQGTYDIGTLTPLQRRAGSPLVMTEDEAKKLEQQVAARSDNLNAPIDANRAAPPSGGDGSPGPYGNVGGYNNFWLDPGTRYTTVDGQKRASLLIDPPDGRLPEMTPEAKRARARASARPTSDQAAREEDPGFEGADAYNDPEMRPLAERCLLGFSSTSGPPMLPTYFYNNLHQIVQTPDTVMILTEMVHDARIVRIGGTHLPATMKSGSAIRSAAGKATRSSSRRRTSPTTRGSWARPEPAGRRALHARRRQDAALSVHRRGSEDVDAAVDGRIHVAGRPTT